MGGRKDRVPATRSSARAKAPQGPASQTPFGSAGVGVSPLPGSRRPHVPPWAAVGSPVWAWRLQGGWAPFQYLCLGGGRPALLPCCFQSEVVHLTPRARLGQTSSHVEMPLSPKGRFLPEARLFPAPWPSTGSDDPAFPGARDLRAKEPRAASSSTGSEALLQVHPVGRRAGQRPLRGGAALDEPHSTGEPEALRPPDAPGGHGVSCGQRQAQAWHLTAAWSLPLGGRVLLTPGGAGGGGTGTEPRMRGVGGGSFLLSARTVERSWAMATLGKAATRSSPWDGLCRTPARAAWAGS